MAEWFMRLHEMLHWWGPGALAIGAFLLIWILIWPLRNEKDIEDLVRLNAIICGCGLFVFYILWFALPHAGTEILLLIFAIPLIGVGLLGVIVSCYMGFSDALYDWDNERRKAKGLPYFDHSKEYETMKEAEWRAFEESEAMLREEDPRRNRLGIIDGGMSKK